jgi:hypothetical protein
LVVPSIKEKYVKEAVLFERLPAVKRNPAENRLEKR